MKYHRRILCVMAAVLAAGVSAASADEGMWLFTNPPRQQLKERYGFDLSDALLERMQKASLEVGTRRTNPGKVRTWPRAKAPPWPWKKRAREQTAPFPLC